MSVNEKLTAIADKIREYAQVDNKFSLGMMPDGIDMVYETGHVAGMDDRDAELADENAELASALTSGGTNDKTIDVNASRAAKDLVMVKNYIKNSLGVDVPEGTLSTVYPNFLLSGAIALINEVEQEIYDTIINPAKDKLSQRMQGKTGTETALGIYVDAAIGDFDAIESALESQGFDVPDNNTSAIAEVIGTACEEKYTLGKTDGYAEGAYAGIEEGKATERDTFWKNYIATMDSSYNSYYAFAGFGWNNNTFRPTRNMRIYNAASMFAMSHITDLAGILEEQGVTINFSSCAQFNSFAYGSNITHLPVISTVSASSLHGMCEGCTGLHTFDKLILKSDGTQTTTNSFDSCSALKNIVIAGAIGSSCNMRWSPLTKDSIKGKEITVEEYAALSATVQANNVYVENGKYYYGGVVTALSSTATGKTLTLKKTAVNTAFETSEGAADGSASEEWVALVATKSNWTISLV